MNRITTPDTNHPAFSVVRQALGVYRKIKRLQRTFWGKLLVSTGLLGYWGRGQYSMVKQIPNDNNKSMT